MIRKLWLVLGCVVVLHGESIDGPRLGYIASATGVRPVLGILGSAHLGSAAGSDLRSLVTLPGQAVAFGLMNETGELIRLGLSDETTTTLPLRGVSKITASPGGRSIAVVVEGSVYVLQPSGEVISRTAIPGAPETLAVSDDGTVAMTVAEGDAKALYLVNQGSANRLFASANLIAPAFAPGSADLVFANESGQLYRIGADSVLSEVGRVEGARAVAATADGRMIVAAGPIVRALRIASGETVSVECPGDASTALPLGDLKFLITGADATPLWILDASSPELRVWFVPGVVNE